MLNDNDDDDDDDDGVLLYIYAGLPDTENFKRSLFRLTALLVTTKDADRQLINSICHAPVLHFTEHSMEAAISSWEWLLAARPDLSAQVIIIIKVIIITEHLILRLKMQANSKAHAFMLPILFSTENVFRRFLKVEREIERS